MQYWFTRPRLTTRSNDMPPCSPLAIMSPRGLHDHVCQHHLPSSSPNPAARIPYPRPSPTAQLLRWLHVGPSLGSEPCAQCQLTFPDLPPRPPHRGARQVMRTMCTIDAILTKIDRALEHASGSDPGRLFSAARYPYGPARTRGSGNGRGRKTGRRLQSGWCYLQGNPRVGTGG